MFRCLFFHNLKKIAGPAVKSECFSYVKKHGRLQDGDVLLTTAGYLPLRSIIHAVVPQFNTGDGKELVALQRMIQNILQVRDAILESKLCV